MSANGGYPMTPCEATAIVIGVLNANMAADRERKARLRAICRGCSEWQDLGEEYRCARGLTPSNCNITQREAESE